MFSDYVGTYTKDQVLNEKTSFKRTYEAYTLTENGSLKREQYLYLYWSPITKWAVRIKRNTKLHYSIMNKNRIKNV